MPNPSYLAPSPDGRFLYAVSELPDGAAAAFALTPHGPAPHGPAVPVGGADPTHLTLADVKGRSIVIHAGGDNYSDQPAPFGGGGARIACGVAR